MRCGRGSRSSGSSFFQRTVASLRVHGEEVCGRARATRAAFGWLRLLPPTPVLAVLLTPRSRGICDWPVRAPARSQRACGGGPSSATSRRRAGRACARSTWEPSPAATSAAAASPACSNASPPTRRDAGADCGRSARARGGSRGVGARVSGACGAGPRGGRRRLGSHSIGLHSIGGGSRRFPSRGATPFFRLAAACGWCRGSRRGLPEPPQRCRLHLGSAVRFSCRPPPCLALDWRRPPSRSTSMALPRPAPLAAVAPARPTPRRASPPVGPVGHPGVSPG